MTIITADCRPANDEPARSQDARSDEFIARRKAAIEFHTAAARAAIMALRGFGEHALVAEILDSELVDTRIEAASIAARAAKGQRKAAQPVRLVAPVVAGA